MNVDFVQYLSIDPAGTWTSKQRKNWLHPDHGPLPDELALLDGNGKTFRVAVWLTNKHILVALETIDESEEDWSPDLRGSILQTFRWTMNAEEEIIRCRTHDFPIPDIEDEDQWRESVIQGVMKESVKICLTTKVGTGWRVTSSSERHLSSSRSGQDRSY